MKALLDIIGSFIALVVLFPVLFITALLILIAEQKTPFFPQERIGKNKRPFTIYKFRTMLGGKITPIGLVLRRTGIDELPQLINVVKGEMSLVGPRPNLYNQGELIAARDELGVYDVLPGITGLAQIKNIDMSTPELLAKTDKQMIETLNIKDYFKYIIKTALGSGSGDAVK